MATGTVLQILPVNRAEQRKKRKERSGTDYGDGDDERDGRSLGAKEWGMDE